MIELKSPIPMSDHSATAPPADIEHTVSAAATAANIPTVRPGLEPLDMKNARQSAIMTIYGSTSIGLMKTSLVSFCLKVALAKMISVETIAETAIQGILIDALMFPMAIAPMSRPIISPPQ